VVIMKYRQWSIVRALVGGAVVWAVVVAGSWGGGVRAQEGRRIWDGVYTEAQAGRGKDAFENSCGRCHNNDLVGSERGPALKGDGFIAHWENDSLDRLFTKIRDTMPAGGIESVTDAAKLDILAYVLARNEAAPGKEELTLDSAKLEAITIVRRGGTTGGVSNFSLVQVVGCLARGANGEGYALSKASPPIVTKEEVPAPAATASAAAAPLGTLQFDLSSVVGAYQAASRVGQKVEARGLIYRSDTENVINLTSLQPLNQPCD
jgi:S-disulfanyl-L-cysteine oxidoreductase SoxD